jgi:hypothetical protein
VLCAACSPLPPACCCGRTHTQALFARHRGTPPSARHLYEVLLEGAPCHLYFDCEFSPAANPGVVGDDLVAALVALVRAEVAARWGIAVPTQVRSRAARACLVRACWRSL